MNGTDYLICLLVFLGGYSINLLYVTVFYHRALTHGGLVLKPAVRRFVARSGNWVTGLDPKAWTCMHRIHHAEADGADDPHSPSNVGIIGVALAQLRSYERILVQLARHEPEVMAVVPDLDFEVSWLNRKKLWWLPYLLQVAIGVALSLLTGIWLLGVAYFVGMMSHPVQGWLVNSFGHAVGSRNFETPDNSRNNHLVAWLVWGEGLQNNHHAYPGSPRFSYRSWEADFGYVVCRGLETIGVLRVRREKLLPRPSAPAKVAEVVE